MALTKEHAAVAAIAVSGILFCLLYHVSRSAYACIGVHAALNLTEGLVWGIPVSGFAINGLLISHRTGPDWLSGGAFGAEASVLSIGCWLLASVLLFELARRRQTLVAPSWRRTS